MARELYTVLELGNSKFVALSAELEEDKVSRVAGWAEVPSYGIRKGVPTDLKAMAHGIEELWDELQRRSVPISDNVYVVISARNISYMIRRGEALVGRKTITREHVENAIENAKSTDPPKNRAILVAMPRFFLLDDSTTAQNPIGMVSSTLEVELFMITAPSTWLANIRRGLNLAGLRVPEDGIIPAGLASSMAVLGESEKQGGVMLMDMGYGTTSVMIYNHGTPNMYITVPLGGYNFSYDLSVALHISEEVAESLKKEVLTFDLASIDDNDMLRYKPMYQAEDRVIRMKNVVTDIMIPRLELIVEHVRRVLERAFIGGKPPVVTIAMTGGMSLMNGIGKYMSELMDGIPTVVAFPSQDWVPEELRSPRYSAVIGGINYILKKNFSEKYYELEPVTISTSRRRRTLLRKLLSWVSEFF